MLSAPSRPAGLPSSPRPNRAPKNPVAPASARPELLTAGPSSLHARSRSQPPRAPSPYRRSPSSTAPLSGDEEAYTTSRLRGRERSRPQPTSRIRQEENSGAPAIHRNQRSRSSTPKPGDRQAKANESSGDGYAIWNTVSTVASALTISVSKAWNSNITTFTGEETPPGQESRLTQAMKAYHIAKARDVSDLPSWLFTERERQAADGQTQPGNVDTYQAPNPTPQGGGGGETVPPEPLKLVSRRHEPSANQPQRLRGTDRLKAMRDVRRGAREPDSSREGGTEADHGPQAAPRPPRIGLPSGPQRGRR